MPRSAVFLCAVALVACSSSDGSTGGEPTTDPTVADTSGTSNGPSTDSVGPGSTSSDPSETEDPQDTGDLASTGSPPDACEGLVGEGFAVDQIAQDWTLTDGDGQPVNLHDYCGKVIFLEIGSEW